MFVKGYNSRALQQTQLNIKEIKAGGRDAFALVVNEYKDLVYSLCLRIIKSSHLAEEAAQDTFVKAYKKLSTFEQRSSLKTWIYRIAYHTALDYARKKTKEVHLDDGMSFESTSQSAISMMEEKELTQVVQRSVEKLGDDERTVITLYYLQEMTIKEIAEITSWTSSNIKIKLFRARKNLRGMLEGSRKKLQNHD